MSKQRVFANERGEFELVISGTEYTLRYTFGALKELEKHFKAKGPQQLLSKMTEWSAGDHMVFILAGMKRGSSPDITLEQLEDLLTLDKLKYYIETIASAMLGVTEEDAAEVEAIQSDEEDPTTPGVVSGGSGHD